MTGKLKYTLLLILVMTFAGLSAQNSQVLYFMNLPQNHMMNPAMRPSNSLYIGLPVFSGINANVNNNFANYSDFFAKSSTSDSIISILNPEYDINKFLDKVKNKNSVAPQFLIQTFGLGFTIKNGIYVFLDINERFEGNFVLPKDMIKLALLGNESFVGSKIDLSTLRMDMKYFREFGFGFSKDFTDKLRIGVRPKILSGIFCSSFDNRSLGISVNSDYSHTIDADGTFNISGPVTVKKNSEQKIESISFDDSVFKKFSSTLDFLTGTGNLGLGLDLGATYDITNKLIVSASITDLGYIKWKRQVTRIDAKSQFQFTGLDMTDVINGSKTMDDLGKELLDSLKDSFIVTTSNTPFTTWLSPGLTLAGSYSLTKNFGVGILSYTRFIGKQMKEAISLSANLNVGNAFSTSLSYTASNHRFDNLGLGLAFRPGVFQFYIMADRIPLRWDKIKQTNGAIILPANMNTMNIRLGMNLVFGNKVKKKDDKPMVIVE